MHRPLASIVLVLSVLAGCGAGAAGGGVGRRAADFTLNDLDGRPVALRELTARRDVVVISFWATWCRPCLVELPFLQEMYERHRSDGFSVLAVSMDGPESEAQVRPTVRRYGWTFPILLDRDTRVGGLYNPRRAAPLSIIVSRDGNVVWSHEGFVAGD